MLPAVQAELANYAGDAKTGVEIVVRALEEPLRQISKNAGIDGSVIVENVKNSHKNGYGYDALKGEYVDMIERGIIDPTKVTRSALQNAASVAAMVLTTESLVADIPAPEPRCSRWRPRWHGRHVLSRKAKSKSGPHGICHAGRFLLFILSNNNKN